MTDNDPFPKRPGRADTDEPVNAEPQPWHDTTMDPADPNGWPAEHGGQQGPEPTRYGDWEKGGRCTDF